MHMRARDMIIAVATLVLAVCATGAMAQQSQPESETHKTVIERWLGSGHADAESEAFVHWNAEGEVPGGCATCHSGAGFRDFHGLDGSAVGSVDNMVLPGGVVDCDTCHADGVREIAAINFPSGMSVSNPGKVATCLTCHQGRAAGSTVSAAVGDGEADTVNANLGFINPHYAAAGATQQGSMVGGGYQYPGLSYMGRFEHVAPFAQCTDCHSPHSLKVEVSSCVRCHGSEDPKTFRTSAGDYDGDGNKVSGIRDEIDTLSATLLEAIEAYSTDIAGIGITYAAHYPYFMTAEGEADAGKPYKNWTPRLLRAAYNYKFVTADHGAYAHNPHYAIQLLHDSIMDISEATGARWVVGERPN